eukprot:TRINITY_DN1840_c0_g1_i1.p1 TRINITY_DN1840_c0_g1~~TRINITY_DN1840_c0_g1_i1.p1  ORF type:complete len:393 (-),score=87.94 TRINITY_DN1840_c0_g1_i1:71-1249(-)
MSGIILEAFKKVVEDYEKLESKTDAKKIETIVQGIAKALGQGIEKCSVEERQNVIDFLASKTDAFDENPLFLVLILHQAGALVERTAGISPHSGAGHGRGECLDTFQLSSNLLPFYTRCVKNARGFAEKMMEVRTDAMGQQKLLQSNMTNPECLAFQSLRMFSPPLQALLGPSPEIRKLWQEDPDLKEVLDSSRRTGNMMAHALIRTLDDEVLVISPVKKKSFLVSFSGLSSSAQLSIALWGLLIDQYLPEVPGSTLTQTQKEVMMGGYNTPQMMPQNQVTLPWRMFQWTAWTDTGKFDINPCHRIFEEGIPADITRSPLDNKRVILIAPPDTKAPLKLPVMRLFSAMIGKVEVVKEYGIVETKALLKTLAETSPEIRQQTRDKLDAFECTD